MDPIEMIMRSMFGPQQQAAPGGSLPPPPAPNPNFHATPSQQDLARLMRDPNNIPQPQGAVRSVPPPPTQAPQPQGFPTSGHPIGQLPGAQEAIGQIMGPASMAADKVLGAFETIPGGASMPGVADAMGKLAQFSEGQVPAAPAVAPPVPTQAPQPPQMAGGMPMPPVPGRNMNFRPQDPQNEFLDLMMMWMEQVQPFAQAQRESPLFPQG